MLGQVYRYRFYLWIQSSVENAMGNSTTQGEQGSAVVTESTRLPMWSGFKSRRRRHVGRVCR